MTTHEPVWDTARRGAGSVFGLLERTAEVLPGGVRWQTLSYQNALGYDPGFWDGVAGIGAFLADYARVTGDARARDLAAGACAWSAAYAPAELDVPEGYAASLGWGWAGIGTAWLRLAAATRDARHLSNAAAMGERVLAAGAGQRPSFLQGTAGRGTFLLRLWHATGAERPLAGAVRCAEALRERLLPAAFGCPWPPPPGAVLPARPMGFAPGLAGIGYFFAVLYDATRDARWGDATAQVAALLSALAAPDRGGLNWPLALDGTAGRVADPDLPRCQWCLGAPGIGLFYLAAARALGDAALLETARAAGEATFAYGDARGNPSQCHGLAGNAELFVELWRATGETVWLDRAGDFAARCLAYRKPGPEGDVWPADDLEYAAPNFSTGAAGVGHLFLRLLSLRGGTPLPSALG